MLTQSVREIEMMNKLHKALGVGKLYINRGCINIVVSSVTDILTVIIPHFDKYPVKGGKLVSYLIFRQAVLAIQNKMHLDPEGFISILNLCYFTHSTSTRSMKSYQNVVNTINDGLRPPLICKQSELKIDFNSVCATNDLYHVDFISGMVDGDGCISFTFSNVKKKVTFDFSISIGLEDYSVLLGLKKKLQCGEVSISISTKKEFAQYRVKNKKDLVEKLIPVLKDFHLYTVKQEYLVRSFEVWDILYTESIQSDKTLQRVVDLVYNMNLGGKLRKISKEAYLELFKGAYKNRA